MKEKFIFAPKKENWPLYLGSALRLISLLLALRVVEPFSPVMIAGLLVLWIPMEAARLPIAGLSVIILQDIAARHRTAEGLLASAVYLALALELLLLFLARKKNEGLERFCEKSRPPQALYPALCAGTAVLMTFYQGSGYFAVGAHGAGLAALLRSYRNLGFHPNWRTVLYSTIMLVILIAWPRKFKRLSKALPAGFVGIVAVTLLNLLLNPNPLRSTVEEFGGALPLFGRLPVSALSMLLIYLAWDEVPWARLRACLREHPVERALLCGIPVALCCFDLLWCLAALALIWDAFCVARLIAQRKLPRGVPEAG
ncbi:MAG: hypothetical protein LBG83_01220 [Oscillospiraceae bacterium]|jgi:hypothetical protein|nr:hypothetical protein [Oscillospiraceae bacterium]